MRASMDEPDGVTGAGLDEKVTVTYAGFWGAENVTWLEESGQFGGGFRQELGRACRSWTAQGISGVTARGSEEGPGVMDAQPDPWAAAPGVERPPSSSKVVTSHARIAPNGRLAPRRTEWSAD